MKTLQTTIGGFMLAAHYCASEAEIDSALCDEIESLAISYQWETVQDVRDRFPGKRFDGATVDPTFPSYDVDDAIDMWYTPDPSSSF